MSDRYATLWQEAVERPQNLGSLLRRKLRNGALDTLSLITSKNSSKSKGFLRFLFCHYVFDNQVAEFENLIICIKKIGQFINTDSALKMTQGVAPIDSQYFHLSFDDGLKNNFTNAIPILLRHQIPCTFFVPTAFIGAEWSLAKHYCLNVTRYRSVIELANWDDLQQAIKEGFEIGSHSHNHARLSSISHNPSQLMSEVADSKKYIEDHLGTECKSIAWPYGTLNDINETGFNAIKAAGYQAAFGNFRQSIIAGKTNLFAIPRHHFEPEWTPRHVRYFANGHWEK